MSNKKKLPLDDFESDGSHEHLEEEDLEDRPAHKQSSDKLLKNSSKSSHAVTTSAGHGGHHEAEIAPTKVPEWLLEYIELFFKIRKRNTTVEMEFYTGAIQFISCLYVLPVVPDQMKRAGYNDEGSIMATTVTCAIGCIIGAFLTDMPFIIAPPTSVSIFFAVSMQQSGFSWQQGNPALMFAGAGLAFLGFVPPVGRFFTKLIPDSIQAAISVGIGLITALAGATEIHLVVRGKFTILDMGEITPEIAVAISNLIVVAVMLHFHVKGAFCIGLVLGTFMWWIIDNSWPQSLVLEPHTINDAGQTSNPHITLLVFNLFFLFILTLNGLARSLSDLGGLTKPNGAIPRGKFLFVVCGLTTMLSAYMSGPPILISPETAAGIKAGARTGLSTLVCGILFGVAAFFSPLFAAVPPAGTAPLLIMVGVMMFGNAKRIDWADYKVAVPAYCVLFFIPFTYSILRGVAIGYIIYIMIGLFTGDMIQNIIDFVKDYTTPKAKAKPLALQEEHHDEPEEPHLEEFEEFGAKPKNFVQRAFKQINKVLDAQDFVGDTAITKIEQM